MDPGPRLGQFIEDGDRRRDAIHMAAALSAPGSKLRSGQPW
jgi:hypothetical protein